MNDIFFNKECIIANGKEWHKLREFIEPISLAIFKKEKETEKISERKRTFHSLPDFSNLKVEKVSNKKYYYYYTNTFYGVIAENVLLDAAQKYPEDFNTNDSNTIIKALNKTRGGPIISYDDESPFKEERYCYVIEEDENGRLNKDRILKLQLFKLQQASEKIKNKNDFTGGLFHAFKHFSFNGICVSTSSEKNLEYHPSYFIKEIANAFFTCKFEGRKNPKTRKQEYYCINNEILFAFFKLVLEDSNVYFLNTSHTKK